MSLNPCRECGAPVSAEAHTCPKCGVKSPLKKTVVPLWAVLAVVLFALWGIGNSFGAFDSAATGPAITGQRNASPDRAAEWRACLDDRISKLPKEFIFTNAEYDPKTLGLSMGPIFHNAQSTMEIYFMDACGPQKSNWFEQCERETGEPSCAKSVAPTIDTEWQKFGRQHLDLLQDDAKEILISYERCLVDHLRTNLPKPNTYGINQDFLDSINFACAKEAVDWRDQVCAPQFGADRCMLLIKDNPQWMLQAMRFDWNSEKWTVKGKIFTPQQVDAFINAQQLAQRGDAKAEAQLGNIYLRGEGIERNLEEAIKWYKKAVEQNDAEAEAQLGSLYMSAVRVPGVPRNSKSEGAALLRKAAKQGNVNAQNTMRIFQIAE